MVNERIEAIYPLTHMQSALLFHSLQASEDQGLLQVTCKLHGMLDKAIFKRSWKQLCQRHSALRTSIHWEDITEPVQVIQPFSALELPWQELDWQEKEANIQEQDWNTLLWEDQNQALTFTQAPLSRFTLVQLTPESYRFVWTCHHILLDGFASLVVLEDLREIYQALLEEKSPSLEPAPPYGAYWRWLSQHDTAAGTDFWKGRFEGFATPERPLIHHQSQAQQPEYQVETINFSPTQTEALKQISQGWKISFNTLVQSLWALVIGKWQSSQDVAFGLTVSGRNIDFPGISTFAYQVMNVAPVRISWEGPEDCTAWFQAQQNSLLVQQAYEHIPLSEITRSLSPEINAQFIESLMVFQGLPWEELTMGPVTLSEVTGKTTSTYPLTALVKSGPALSIRLRMDVQRIAPAFAPWASRQWNHLIEGLLQQEQLTLSELGELLESPPREETQATTAPEQPHYQQPTTSTEILLSRIWEKVLGRNSFGIDDNFFEIGGSSIFAVQVFAEIQAQAGKKLPHISLMTHPTIRELAPLLESESISHWASMVSLQGKGNKPPLFVMHDIGGDLFIYRDLITYLGEDQPVLGFQAKGLDGNHSPLRSIPELAAHYCDDILKVYPDGPFLLAGISFGGILAYEMGQQLVQRGKTVDLLALLDTYPNPGVLPYGQQGAPAGLKYLRKLDTHIGRMLVQGIPARVKHYRQKAQKKWSEKIPLIPYKENIPAERNTAIWSANEEAIAHYFMEPFAGKLTLFLSDKNYFRVYEDVRLGWHAYAQKGLELHVVPGDHLSIMYEPNVQVLAKQLKGCLERVISP